MKLELNQPNIHIRKYSQNHITDVCAMNFKPQPHIKKINKDQYIKPASFEHTGEVFTFMENNERNKRSLRKIFKGLRQTVNANFVGGVPNEKVLTLTYAENMKDEEKASKDFKIFFKCLRRNMPEHNLEYISIIEPQGRGAWHYHVLIKSMNQDTLKIDYKELYRMWGHGRVHCMDLTDINNMGAYFVAYMSNVELDDEAIKQMQLEPQDIIERPSKDGSDKPKRFIKGERLSMYPDYMQIWRHSRGIKKVDGEWTDKSELKNMGTVTYDKTFEIKRNDKDNEVEDEMPALYVRNMQFNRKINGDK